jgi:hypothetical protein
LCCKTRLLLAIGFGGKFLAMPSSSSPRESGSPEATRRLVNKAFLEALAKDFREGGAEAIAKVRKEQPAAYMKICALLVPREMKVEHSQSLKSMTDEELDEAIAAVRAMLDERAKQGDMIDVTPEPEQGKK